MINNLAIGQKINLAEEFNKKIETGVLQTELALESPGTSSGQAVRENEYTVEHDTLTGIHDVGFLVDQYVSATAGIQASKIAMQKNYRRTATAIVPSATANTNGTAVTLTPPAGFAMIQPLACDIVFGGTFNSETMTVTFTINYADYSNITQTFTATATGTTSLTNTQLMSFIKDSTYIISISTVAKSTIANSIATVSLNRCGLYL